MNLIEIFLELDVPKTENSKLFNATTLAEFPFAKIGINFFGFPVVLISSIYDPTSQFQKNIRLKYLELTHNLECKISENGESKNENYCVIIFRSDDQLLQKYFLGIAETLINSLSSNPTETEIFERFKNFIEIFRSLTEMPTKEIQGLWGELLLIEQSKNPELLINYWHILPEEKFDFNADNEKIEVKSSCTLERVHTFSAEQLNPTNNSQVIIASIFTKQISNGLNVFELAEKINNRVSENELKKKVFNIISKTLGNTFEQTARIRYDYNLGRNSLKFYRHQDIAKIERVNIPEKVSTVKFKSDLSNIENTELFQLANKKTLFKAL